MYIDCTQVNNIVSEIVAKTIRVSFRLAHVSEKTNAPDVASIKCIYIDLTRVKFPEIVAKTGCALFRLAHCFRNCGQNSSCTMPFGPFF